VPVKNSICLSCLNFPRPLHRRSGRVSVQAVMPVAGVPMLFVIGLGTFEPHHVAGSSPFLRSAGSIAATSASPDRDRARRRPLQMADLSRWLPGPRPRGAVAGRSLIPSPPGALSLDPEVYTEHHRGVGRPPMRFLTGTGTISSQPHSA
jgi:hypothetical protein